MKRQDRWAPVESGLKRIPLLTQQVVTAALDLVFPPHCVNCERVGSFLCPRCRRTLVPAEPRVVDGLDHVYTSLQYTGAVQAVIHAFKYYRQTQLADMLGGWLCDALRTRAIAVDCVAAVPLHSQRLTERGYNQATLIAQHVAICLQLPFVDNALDRVRETSTQVHLTAQERRANVAGAFAAQPEAVARKHVLLIDDVLTTGATLVACAEALRQAGAAHVTGAAVASPVFIE